MVENNIVSSQDSGENHASIDIDSFIQKLSQRSNPSLGTTICIYRVHKRIREMNEDAYTPDRVSLGPHYRGMENLNPMEDLKLQYAQALLDRTRNGTSLEEYVEVLKELEAEARGCYSEPIELSPKEFLEMMLLDGFFIIELFRKILRYVPVDVNDPIFYSISKKARVVRDLVLIENQIPISVLQRLFDLSKDPNDRLTLIEMALYYFEDLVPQAMHRYRQNNMNIRHDHLLDLLSYTFSISLPTIDEPPLLSTPLESLPCVVELRRSGVKFKKSLTSNSLIDVKFNKGVFEIPLLCITDYTDSLFRNLIAYEQYRFRGKHYITSYAILMDYLINSSDDVAFLRDRGIIMNHLGDDNKVSSLFSNLCSEVTHSDFYYSELCDKVNRYYKRRFHQWRATLKGDYRNNPLTIISVVAAIVLLFLTAWGTVFTTLQVYNVHA